MIDESEPNIFSYTCGESTSDDTFVGLVLNDGKNPVFVKYDHKDQQVKVFKDTRDFMNEE